MKPFHTKFILLIFLASSIFLICESHDATAQCSPCGAYTPAGWPINWVAYRYTTGYVVQDTADESPDESDIYYGPAGDSASVLVGFENGVAYFRMQLRADPSATGGASPLKQTTWLVQIRGSNGYHLLTVGCDGNNPDNIFIYDTTSTYKLTVYTLSSNPTAIRLTAINGTGRYYLDFQVPLCALTYWSCLYARQTITSSTPLIFYYGTSQAASSQVNKDFSTCTGNCTLTILDYLGLALGTFDHIETGILPVELSSFRASLRNGTVELAWTTQTETNNYGFEVQRSDESGNWTSRGFVSGNGTSNRPQSYSFIDDLSSQMDRSNRIAYRLKQIDRDGAISYSHSIDVPLPSRDHSILGGNYPNPLGTNELGYRTAIPLTLQRSEAVRLIVTNTLGKEVASIVDGMMESGSHVLFFDTRGLPAGMYYTVLQTESGERFQQPMLLVR